jgi:hypothetical protein
MLDQGLAMLGALLQGTWKLDVEKVLKHHDGLNPFR